MAAVPAGDYAVGSTRVEREYGYRLDEERGSDAARRYQWFENEVPHVVTLDAYLIDRYLVTNADYQRFVDTTGHGAPFVDEATWKNSQLIHPYRTVRKFLWANGQFPNGRADHPVVLVDQVDAEAYCTWRGTIENRPLRLPE